MAKKFIVEIPAPIRIMKDSGPVDFRQKRWDSPAAAIAGIPVPLSDGTNRVDADGVTIPTRVLGQRIPVLVGGRTVDYWWESDLSDAGFVPVLRDYALTVNVNNQINNLAQEIATDIQELREELDTDVLHRTGDETKTSGVLTFVQSPKGPEGTADDDLVNTAQILKLPLDIRFQKILRRIPHIRVTTSAYNKVKDFVRIVAANNYTFVRLAVVNQNSTVKTFEFMTGYDALSDTTWSKLTPLQVYNDRGQDFDIEIKKVSGFSWQNFGVIIRYRNLTPGSGSECSISMDMAYQLPAVGVNYDQFDLLTTPEYDWNGINGLYGIKLTQTGDGRNYVDDLGQMFVKDGSQLILDLQNYKADTAYVNARLQVVEEDIEYIEETLLPLKQDKTAAEIAYDDLLQRIQFLQSQLDEIPNPVLMDAAMISRLPLINSQEELDALPIGDPYRTIDGFVLYHTEGQVFGAEFNPAFGGGGEPGETYNGIFTDTFDLQFEL